MSVPTVGSQTNNFLHSKKQKHSGQDQGADPETQIVIMLIVGVLWGDKKISKFQEEKKRKRKIENKKSKKSKTKYKQ